MAGEGAERHGKGREHGRRPVRIADDDRTSIRREFEGEKRYSPGREQQAVESVLSDDAAGDDELAGGIQSSTAQSAAERVAEVEDRQ